MLEGSQLADMRIETDMAGTPSVARVKAELQSNGLQIPLELIDELETKWNAPAAGSGRLVVCLKSPAGELIPAFIVNGKRGANSPFHLAKDGEQFEVRTNGEKYSDAFFIKRPGFYDRMTSGNVPMPKLAVIVGPGHARSVVDQRCYYQQIAKPCKFCAVQHWWDSNIEKTSLQIAETIAAGVNEGVVEHISLTTATSNTPSKGLEHLVETVKLITERVDIPVMIEFEPIEDDAYLESLLRQAKQAGVTTVSCNIECFDENLREEIMPAKGMIPIRQYMKTWGKCIDIFGKNDVYTVCVVGTGEDDKSILNGIEMAASIGVMTFLVPHSPAIGAVYEDMQPPTSARMLGLYSQAVEIYRKYGLDLCSSQAGCVRGGGFSAIKDVARFGT
jgi:radical SAM protein (TIGR04043 family)